MIDEDLNKIITEVINSKKYWDTIDLSFDLVKEWMNGDDFTHEIKTFVLHKYMVTLFSSFLYNTCPPEIWNGVCESFISDVKDLAIIIMEKR